MGMDALEALVDSFADPIQATVSPDSVEVILMALKSVM